ncbi:MAG: S8 family peptidase [Crocinitomicaceae bacterium]
MNFLVLCTYIFLGFSAYGQVKISANCKADLLHIQKKTINKQLTNFEEKYPVYKLDESYYVNLLFKVESNFLVKKIESIGAVVGGQSQNILSVKWPVNKIDLIWTVEGVEVIQLAQKIRPTLSKSRFDTRVDSVHSGIGLNSPFTGKNVLIGVTDWGFDYSSPMFYDTLLQNTRILAAWDQFKTSGPHPMGFNYGAEYNTQADLISAGTDTANIYSYGTHGTHVAGIAGGSGAGTDYRGMAFESQFLMTTFLVDEAAVLDAWQWMYDKAQAEGKRLVINMSWGLYHTGALDGTSLLSQALDNFSQQGVVFVTSAGNNGDEDFHIKYNFSSDTMRTRVNFYSGTANNLWGQSIHGWGEPNQSFEVKLKVLGNFNNFLTETPWYGTAYTSAYVDTFLVIGTDSVFYNLSLESSYPTNGRPQMRVRIKKQPANYRVVLESTSSTGIVHYWNVTELSSDVGNWGMPFSSLGAGYTAGDALYSIGAPACSGTAITVAAHKAEYEGFNGNIFGGDRANFSSIGPLITEEMKPDISAPGFGVASSISSYTDNGFTSLTTIDFNGRTYHFSRFSGTSMSSPAVAGITALMLEANPDLSPHQVKQILMQTARLDDETGTIGLQGDPMWGVGKANAYYAIKRSLNTVGQNKVSGPKNYKIYPNPTSGVLKIEGLTDEVNAIQLISLTGQVLATFENQAVVDLSIFSAGFYVLRFQKDFGYDQEVIIIN